MFLLRRPSPTDIQRFLDRSRELPLSYSPIGILNQPGGRRLDEQTVVIGRGDADFQRARAAILTWKHFDIGWVEAVPARPGIDAGTNVAVPIGHLGFWSLNGARVLHSVDDTAGRSIGFTYGTLTNHAESGEERFQVFVDSHSGNVIYKIRAISWAQSPLAWIGQPIVRQAPSPWGFSLDPLTSELWAARENAPKRLDGGQRCAGALTPMECYELPDIHIADAIAVGHAERAVADVLPRPLQAATGHRVLAGLDESYTPGSTVHRSTSIAARARSNVTPE